MTPAAMQSFLDGLRARGLLSASSEAEVLVDHLAAGRKAYLGMDPTADSLHVGHLLPLMLMRRLAAVGFPPVLLIGGATAAVGDPSGRQTGRPMLSHTELATNAWSLADRALALVPGAIVLDNLEWTKDLSVLDFLRDVGSKVPMSVLLRLDSLKARLEGDEGGLTFMEAAYPLLQAMDFRVLAERHDVGLQVGGQDQWGNVQAGRDLWRRTHPSKPHLGFALTPLLVNARGEKMGKSGGSTIWLKRSRTTDLEFHQFFLCMPDDDARLVIPPLWDGSDEEVAELLSRQGSDFNVSKRALADQITLLVRGADGLRRANEGALALMGLAGTQPPEEAVRISVAHGTRLTEVMVKAGFAPSLTEARRLVENAGVRLDGRKVEDVMTVLEARGADRDYELRVGKKRVAVVSTIST